MAKKKRIRGPYFTDLNSKTIVFTGGTDGMGRVAVEKLAAMNANILLLGRNIAKTEKVIEELKSNSGKKIRFINCDLASQDSIRKSADGILKKTDKIDFLVNCAGANLGARKVNNDGYEMSWAINHLGPFFLTKLLLERLKQSSPSRIINLSSATEKWGHIHLDDLQLEKKFSTLRGYAQAKLAMNMCTRIMAKQLKGSGVTINALNPGFIKTNLLRDTQGWEAIIGVPYMFFFASKPEVGANRIITLMLSKEYEKLSGKFIYEDYVKNPNPEALNDKLCEKVYQISLNHVGL